MARSHWLAAISKKTAPPQEWHVAVSWLAGFLVGVMVFALNRSVILENKRTGAPEKKSTAIRIKYKSMHSISDRSVFDPDHDAARPLLYKTPDKQSSTVLGTSTQSIRTSEFRNKLRVYKYMPGFVKSSLKGDLDKAAVSRYIEMRWAAQTDPAAVVSNVLTPQERKDVPQDLKKFIEKDVPVEGKIWPVQSDVDENENNLSAGPSDFHYSIETNEGPGYEANFAKDPGPIASGGNISGTAVGLDESLTFAGAGGTNSTGTSQQYTASVTTTTGTNPPMFQQYGEKRVAVILVKFTSTDTHYIDPTWYRDAVFNKINNFYKESSYYNADPSHGMYFTGDVFGWYTMPKTVAGYPSDLWGGCYLDSWPSAINKVLASQGVDLSGYDYRMYVEPGVYLGIGDDGVPRSRCGYYNAYGSIGPLVPGSYQWTQIFYDSILDRLAAHELGHNLGLWHSNTYCPSSYGSCGSYEYKDNSSVMNNSTVRKHHTGAHKVQLGWIPDDRIITHTAGTAEHTISLLETTDLASPQIIKIPKSNGENYYVSYRMPVGSDSVLASIYYGGATLHILNGDRRLGSQIFQQSNGTYVLKDGQYYYDSKNQIRITQLSHTDRTVTVQVTMPGVVTPSPTRGPTPTPGPTNTPTPTRPPTPTPSPRPTPAGAGWSNLDSVTTQTMAKFLFDYVGPPSVTYYAVDVSTEPTMAQSYRKVGFAYAYPPSTTAVASSLGWSGYKCGSTFYWWVRSYDPANHSPIQTAFVQCGSSPTPTPRVTSVPTATPTLRATATPTLQPTATPTPRPTATPTNAPLPTATPTPETTGSKFTNVSASTTDTKAEFHYDYTNSPSVPYFVIDTSTDPNMALSNRKVGFGYGYGSSTRVITVSSPTSWSGYKCGATFYWWVRTWDPNNRSDIQTATVQCGGASGGAVGPAVSLSGAAINNGDGSLAVTYTQTSSAPTYVTSGSDNVILQSGTGFTNTTPNTTESRPLANFLGTLTAGTSIRLCTGDYSVCSNTLTIGTTLGVSSTLSAASVNPEISLLTQKTYDKIMQFLTDSEAE